MNEAYLYYLLASRITKQPYLTYTNWGIKLGINVLNEIYKETL